MTCPLRSRKGGRSKDLGKLAGVWWSFKYDSRRLDRRSLGEAIGGTCLPHNW